MTKYVGPLPKLYVAKTIEDYVRNFWAQSDIYQLVKKEKLPCPKFYFLDGPPFPSSDTPHIGTCWNKVLKDSVIRYHRTKGFNVHDQPGYDCHGLPIELAVEQKFGVKTKKDIEQIGLEKFVTECREFATNNSISMTRTFQELGVWMDWASPYMTHDDSYIESDWWSLKQAWKNRLFEHGLRVVHWCPRDETVLSDYEVVLEYKVLRDPSIYVKFQLEAKDNEFVLIWTTTPWTLPSNVAVMVNPTAEYVKARHGNELLILARARVKSIEDKIHSKLEIVETFPGSKLEGLRYRSPLENLVLAQKQLENGHRVVLSEEYVTLDEGTGCVHSAPGHGEEDYEVGVRYHLPIVMLVNDQGKLVEDAGKYSGKSVREANPEIIEDLKTNGTLLYSEEIEHRSPVCWRCKTPLIIRATDQWIVRVAHLKDTLIKEVDETKWVPDWAGASQFTNWLANLKDWVVSRQRFWGTPLPVWTCRVCNEVQVVGSKEELLNGSTTSVNVPNLHVPWVDKVKLRCKCGGEMTRIPDVMVGWYDSGAASYASLGQPKHPELTKYWWPADFIVEGRDQISGWFFSLLKAGVVTMGTSPYKTVLMHGFVLDDKGREMHKSLGNYVTAQEVIQKFGRDIFRYYVLQTTIWEDLNFSWDAIKQYSGDLSTFWNTYVFASTYMNLDKFPPQRWPLKRLARSLRPEDKWLLSRTHHTIKEVTAAMDGYKIHEAVRKLKTFLVEDLSHTYVRCIRRRTWIERETATKHSAYATLYFALKSALVMMTPILPFITEAVYQNMFRNAESGNPETVHLLTWPVYEEKMISEELEAEMDAVKTITSTVALIRSEEALKQRQPVKRIIVASDSVIARNALRTYSDLLLEQLNTHALSCIGNAKRFKYDQTLRPRQFAKSSFPDGTVYIDLKLTAEMIAEGLARDIVRRIQQMRKEMDLKVDSFIEANVVVPQSMEKLLKTKRRYMARETRAKRLIISAEMRDARAGGFSKKWEINKENYELIIREMSTQKRRKTNR